jgi:NIPSNAP
MQRRELLTGLAASTLFAGEARSATVSNTYLELKTWRLHNSAEDQSTRVATFLDKSLAPALARTGAKLAGAFSNAIGQDGPYYLTLTQFASLGAMQEALAKLDSDESYQQGVEALGSGAGLPFVRIESSVLRSFDVMPQVAAPEASGERPSRIFELRTYESQSPATLKRKVAMFNNGEAQIFQRLGMRPVFFGEAIIGPRQPCLTYMLSYHDLAARDKLWHDFISDPEWKKLSARPELKDSEIVANISNVILNPLKFSAIR